MCSFTRAFDCPRWIKLISMIVNGPSPTLPSKYSTTLNDILQRMLMKDPELRPSAKEILQFPYVTQRGQGLSEWLQEVVYQDRKDSVDEDVSRITAAMQEKLHLDSLHAMIEVQEMAPRQRRRIRQEEEPNTHMKKFKRAVERVYEENRQRMEQNIRYKANDDDCHWIEDKPVEPEDIHSEEEESIDGSILSISLPLSEQQSSTIRAYQNCLQRFLDSSSNTAEIPDSAPWDSEDTTVSVCSKQEIELLRQECVQLLGEEAFLEVYNYWKVYNQQDPASQEIEDNTLCEPQVMKLYPQHCYKVQQLLFLEERMEVESTEPSFTWL